MNTSLTQQADPSVQQLQEHMHNTHASLSKDLTAMEQFDATHESWMMWFARIFSDNEAAPTRPESLNDKTTTRRIILQLKTAMQDFSTLFRVGLPFLVSLPSCLVFFPSSCVFIIVSCPLQPALFCCISLQVQFPLEEGYTSMPPHPGSPPSHGSVMFSPYLANSSRQYKPGYEGQVLTKTAKRQVSGSLSNCFQLSASLESPFLR